MDEILKPKGQPLDREQFVASAQITQVDLNRAIAKSSQSLKPFLLAGQNNAVLSR